MLYDISPPLSPAIAVFPGDTPLSREVLLRVEDGAPVTLSTLRTTVHVGAHADAPSHYGPDAATIDRMPLERYLGPCQVVEVSARRGALATPADLLQAISESRVLLRTGSQPDKVAFPPDFVALSPELVEHLAELGVTTVGVDTPSVDPGDSKDLPAHKAFLRTGVCIIEGLALDGVPVGRYELIALPLRLVGFDASPVRAVLRSIGDAPDASG